MSGLYENARKLFLEGGINWLTDDIRAILIDEADLTSAKAITDATNATPIVVTATGHGFANGDIVTIHGVAGNTNANGCFKIKNVATNTFELTDPRTNANIAGNGTYISGGMAINLTNDDYLNDIAAAARVAVSGSLANKSSTKGIADADDVTFITVTGDQSEVVILYKHTGVESTSALIALMDAFTAGMPVTANGGDITVAFDNGSNKIFRL